MKSAIKFVDTLYELMLKREPGIEERNYWVSQCDIEGVAAVVRAFFESEEYKGKRGVIPAHEPGHFYSPINNPADLDYDAISSNAQKVQDIKALELNFSGQRQIWARISQFDCKFAEERDAAPARRYYVDNPVYGSGDAAVLCGMLALKRPSRVIEIGSGFSSACMLDAADSIGLNTKFVFVEPNPDRLYGLLHEHDLIRCEVLEEPVQRTNLAMYDMLEKDDVLFIDSTHVMKAGSDVNFELFEILPRLKSGVIIHFHDMFWPFEYPADWIFSRRYSWNELYGLRAFLSYNSDFQILFFNHAFATCCRDDVENAPIPLRDLFVANPGGGLWLQKR